MTNDFSMYIIGGLLAVSMGVLAIGHYLWLKGHFEIDEQHLKKDLEMKDKKESEDTKRAA
ncbi:MAG: hypothetical protein ACO20H_04875 [Bacteriovoracaceae bacterium]